MITLKSYPLHEIGINKVEMPKRAKILGLRCPSFGVPVELCTMVELSSEKKWRRFLVAKEGDVLPFHKYSIDDVGVIVPNSPDMAPPLYVFELTPLDI